MSDHTELSQVGRAASYRKGQEAMMQDVLPITVKNHLKSHPHLFFAMLKNQILKISFFNINHWYFSNISLQTSKF